MSTKLAGLSSTPVTVVDALHCVRPLRGGSQSKLLLCSDTHLYITKFQHNPQGSRILVNEYIGTELARSIGLPVPPSAFVRVSAELIAGSPDLCFQTQGTKAPCPAGLQFGSRLAGEPESTNRFDYLPLGQFLSVVNLTSFLGAFVFDKWTCNTDRRQAVFWKPPTGVAYTATFIDQGNCVNGQAWTFPDAPLYGLSPHRAVYDDIRDWSSLEPWLQKVERFDEARLWEIAAAVPAEWYANESPALEQLMAELLRRRKKLGQLLQDSVRQWNMVLEPEHPPG